MRRVLFGVVMAAAALALAHPAHAQQPPDTTAPPPTSAPAEGGATEPESGVTGGGTEGEQTPVTLPLVPVPVGCTAPALPHIVFVGKVVDRDFRSVRFEIEQIRAGQAAPFASDNQIDVRYGLDAQYLHDGERYLVSAPVDPDLGLLVSRVTPVVANFGGDEVIGVSESDVNCPAFEDPLRTLHLDGTPVESRSVEAVPRFEGADPRCGAGADRGRAGRDLPAGDVPTEHRRACTTASSTPAGAHADPVSTPAAIASRRSAIASAQSSSSICSASPRRPAVNEHSGDDRLADDVLERDRVGRELAPVAGDPLGAVGAWPPGVGLVVDDHVPVVGAHEQVDVPLEHAIADGRGDEQLAVVFGSTAPPARPAPRAPSGRVPRPIASSPMMPSAAHWAAASSSMSWPCVEIAELERAVHGAADSGAVAPALPRRELEVDGVLAKPFVGRRAGVVPAAGDPRRAVWR